jgi:hypothetical protein
MQRRSTAALPQAPRLAAPRFRGLFASRNIRALAGHVGCSESEARELYDLSRLHGYGAAHSMLFPDDAAAARRRTFTREGVPAVTR